MEPGLTVLRIIEGGRNAMETNGLVSVIIPVYNVRPYLEEALDSVLSQTYDNLEILVIDDGSTDGSGEICDAYAKRDRRIHVIHQQNRGLSAARNVGLDRMTGELVAFLDSDDALRLSFIEEMRTVMVREDVDSVVCRYTVHETYGRLEDTGNEAQGPTIEGGRYDRDAALRAYVDGRINWSVWNKMYRREVWRNVRFPEGHVFEDLAIALNVFEQCHAVQALDHPLYRYRVRPESIMHSISPKQIEDWMLADAQYVSFVEAHTPAVFSPDQLVRVHRNRMNAMMSSYFRYCREARGDAYGGTLRRRILAEGRKTGMEDATFRMRVAHRMLYFCPWLLRWLYPAYRAVRQGIWKLTGR